MSAPWPDVCAYCRKPLPASGNKRRPIPRLHGRRRLVHAECALELDRQLVIEEA